MSIKRLKACDVIYSLNCYDFEGSFQHVVESFLKKMYGINLKNKDKYASIRFESVRGDNDEQDEIVIYGDRLENDAEYNERQKRENRYKKDRRREYERLKKDRRREYERLKKDRRREYERLKKEFEGK